VTEIVGAVEKTVGHNWRAIWIYPSLMAIAILIFFQIFFKDNTVVGREDRVKS
jgi:hypothetical protein